MGGVVQGVLSQAGARRGQRSKGPTYGLEQRPSVRRPAGSSCHSARPVRTFRGTCSLSPFTCRPSGREQSPANELGRPTAQSRSGA